MKITDLRRKIDRIDRDIVRLLNERAKIALYIGRLKSKKNQGFYMPDREADIYRRILDTSKGPLPKKAILDIYREIMSSSLALEKDIKIAYLGPEASFTHLAAIRKFGKQVNYVSCNSITDVFREVEAGRADYGVVPVENSTEGAVNHTLDMFISSELKICSEVLLEISHSLLARCNMKSIRRVYSNPQVFGQCRTWLDTNLHNVELIEVSTTSRAAEIASREKGAAAIGSILAAARYRLKILAKDIEDNPNNITRFLVIGQYMPQPTGEDKTSIVFSCKDRVGVLHDMLVPFKRHKVNLTKIESRPSKKKAWEYYFYIDMAGHYQDSNVKKALKGLERHCTYLKVLGSYPAALQKRVL